DESHDELRPQSLQLLDHLTAERVVGVVLCHSGPIKYTKQPRHQIGRLAAVQPDLQQLGQIELNRELNPLLECGDLGLHSSCPNSDLGQLILSEVLDLKVPAR